MKKKILILTASFGTGHLTASRSIEEALLKFYPEELEIKTIDFIEIENFAFFGRISEKIYNFLMEYPYLWDFVFRVTDFKLWKSYYRTVFQIFYKKAYKILSSENPDLCITIHPFWNFLIDGYNKHLKEKKKYICVVTDAIQIHHVWITSGAEYYIVCDKDTADVMTRYNIDKNRTFAKGFPVSLRFSSQVSREKFLTELGLKPELTTFLIVIGLGDTRKFLKVINYLTKLHQMKFQLIIITGKYKNIYSKLANKSFLVPTKVVGWTDKMAELIKSSDLVISKGGGAIVMEALAAGKPVFIPVFTPGQERGNAELIKRYEFGFVERNFRKITEMMRDLISNHESISKITNGVKEYSNPHAAEDIAKFAHDVIFE